MDGGCRGIGATIGVVILLLLVSVVAEKLLLPSVECSMPRGLSSWRWRCFCESEEEPFREKENLEKRPPPEFRLGLVSCCGVEFS